MIEGFDLVSYHAGVNMAFAEVVGAGCKRLALSSPYDPELAEKMMEPTRESAARGHPAEMELDVARAFGRLLSYSEEKIEALIEKYG